MRFSLAASLLSGGALALTRTECFAQNGADLAEFSTCGHHGSLAHCLTHLAGDATSLIEQCYVDAGCSTQDASSDAHLAIQRCLEFANLGHARRRSRAAVQPEQTPASVLAARAPGPAPTGSHLEARDTLQCLITETVQTSTCPVATSGVHLKTLSCFPTQVAKSRCAPGLMCSLDPAGSTVCMKMQNSLDIGGIIISIIFGVAIVIGISALTFMCCKERRYQKKLEARAEATALARAQTKKQRAADARAPLMRQEGGGGDPFSDQNRS